MRFLRRLMPLGLAAMILGGCVQTVQLVVHSDPESGDLVIDQSHHAKPVVKPGDRVVWTCDCPPNTEFAVSDLRFVTDIDDVFDLALEHGLEGATKRASRIQRLESLQRNMSAAPQTVEASEDTSEQWEADVQETIALLKKLESMLFPEEQRKLFKGMSMSMQDTGPKWADGGARIRSPGRVTKGIGHGLWKFTWLVRKKGDPNAVPVIWDPHIEGHERTN
jgi:hypothetical protein